MALKAPLPSGTVTLLFTDIEGSTQHWERQRERDGLLPCAGTTSLLRTAAIETHDGHVFKTVGDAFCAAFSQRFADAMSPRRLDAQKRARHPRIGPASTASRCEWRSTPGSTDERDGDYFGPAVNRVARLLAIGHGGQVLRFGPFETELIPKASCPPRAALRDLGEHRLRRSDASRASLPAR